MLRRGVSPSSSAGDLARAHYGRVLCAKLADAHTACQRLLQAEAASCIQRAYRAHLSTRAYRRDLSRRLQQRSQHLLQTVVYVQAAVQIQACFRGFATFMGRLPCPPVCPWTGKPHSEGLRRSGCSGPLLEM
eukprot:RCo038627